MAEKQPRKQVKAPRGKDLVKEALEHKELVKGTEEGYQDLAEGRVVRWEDVKRRLPDV